MRAAELSRRTVVIARVVPAGARPAGLFRARARRAVASRANRVAATLGGEDRGRFTEANRGNAHACGVLRRPARGARCAGQPGRLFARFAEVEGSEAVARVIGSRGERLSRPATAAALARGGVAARADARADARRRKGRGGRAHRRGKEQKGRAEHLEAAQMSKRGIRHEVSGYSTKARTSLLKAQRVHYSRTVAVGCTRAPPSGTACTPRPRSAKVL